MKTQRLWLSALIVVSITSAEADERMVGVACFHSQTIPAILEMKSAFGEAAAQRLSKRYEDDGACVAVVFESGEYPPSPTGVVVVHAHPYPGMSVDKARASYDGHGIEPAQLETMYLLRRVDDPKTH